MKEKTIFICENCGKEFASHEACEQHEINCCNKHQKYKENVKQAVEQAKEKYHSIIKSISYKTDAEADEMAECDNNLYKYEINVELSNGNKFAVYDGCDEYSWLGNYLNAETIFKSLDEAISNEINTKYEGILHEECDDGYYINYIGDVTITDITRRLNGRKVRLEVIE